MCYTCHCGATGSWKVFTPENFYCTACDRSYNTVTPVKEIGRKIYTASEFNKYRDVLLEES